MESHQFFHRYKAEGFPDKETDAAYSIVPKSTTWNLRWRNSLIEAGYGNQDIAHEVSMLCKRDLLFFINTFVWILETRDEMDWEIDRAFGNSRTIPFITRAYQDKVLLEVLKHLGKKDIVIPKSRETGLTWMMIAVAVWDWMFKVETHIGFVSKDEASVIFALDPDSLFSKFHFILKTLPKRMLDES